MIRIPILVPQGIPFILLALLWLFIGYAMLQIPLIVIGWLMLAIFLWIFRNPRTKHLTPLKRFSLVSPLHGRVIAIEETQPPYQECKNKTSVHIRLRMGWLDATTLFSPATGKIRSRKISMPAIQHAQPKPYAYFVVDTDEGDEILIIISLLHPLAHISCLPYIGERVGIGQLCGYCYFSCFMDLYLPPRVRTFVKPGERLIGGKTRIAEIVPMPKTAPY